MTLVFDLEKNGDTTHSHIYSYIYFVQKRIRENEMMCQQISLLDQTQSSVLLPLFQIVGHFNKFKYIYFIINLDIIIYLGA